MSTSGGCVCFRPSACTASTIEAVLQKPATEKASACCVTAHVGVDLPCSNTHAPTRTHTRTQLRTAVHLETEQEEAIV